MIDRMRLPFSGDTNRLRQLQIPVLILWGQKDQLIPVSQADKFAAVLPHNQKIIFPALGHVPMEEAPAEIANNIRNWLIQ
jgi:pimeloyl-ACP methyl ester carboxylesterase